MPVDRRFMRISCRWLSFLTTRPSALLVNPCAYLRRVSADMLRTLCAVYSAGAEFSGQCATPRCPTSLASRLVHFGQHRFAGCVRDKQPENLPTPDVQRETACPTPRTERRRLLNFFILECTNAWFISPIQASPLSDMNERQIHESSGYY